jgi:hypothetical protein
MGVLSLERIINNTWYYVDPTLEINDVGNWTLIGSDNFINHSASKIYDNLTKHVSKTDFRTVIAHNPDSFQECIGFYLIMTIAGIIFGKELGMIILKRQLAM